MARARSLAFVGAACATLAVATVAAGYVPPAERIHEAVAATNRSDGRHHAIRLELSMQVGERAGVATAELISHPTGLARLELRGAGGLIERHLLLGSELAATRNGEPLDDPRAFLLPFFILQAETGTTLRAALSTFSVLPEAVGLAVCGESDCLLIGDPRRTIPRPPLPPVRGLEAYRMAGGELSDAQALPRVDAGFAAGEPAGGFDSAASRSGDVETPRSDLPALDGEGRAWPRVWVEHRSFEVRGFDGTSGARIRLGPLASFGELRVPSWFTVEEPGRIPARFDVLGATRVDAPAAAFKRDWLYAVDVQGGAPNQPLDAEPEPGAAR